MVAPMTSRLIHGLFGLLFIGIFGSVRGQDTATDSSSKVTYPLKVPAEAVKKEEPPKGEVTRPFKPAVRVPQPLKVPPANLPMTNLVFDAEVKEQRAKPLEYNLSFTFAVTNASEVPVVIGSVRTSCGCTVAKVPDLPWKLEVGGHGTFDISMDLHGKRGSITKSVFISTDQGSKTIYVRGILPDPESMTPDQRKQNQLLAKADRQAVFKGQCASCHATPTINKTGSALFEAACNICHSTAHRAEMVPDLSLVKASRDRDYWMKWITEGKDGTLMPAFSKEKGGPLSDAQIVSLAHWLTQNFPNGQSVPETPVRRIVPVDQ